MRNAALVVLAAAVAGGLAPARADEEYDVVIYGGTAGGIMAGVQAARMGKSVVVIDPGTRLGGLTTGGLSFTDTGNTGAIQGIAREFYTRVGERYGQGTPEWRFEPHVAEAVLEEMIADAGITVYRNERLDRGAGGVAMSGARIDTIRTESGRVFGGGVFIDAGYEGDLMAAAGVSYAVGRESNAVYGETYNGVQTARATKHQFSAPVDPYVTPGDASSGLLPYVSAEPPGIDGQGDHRVQAYNFRLTVTRAADRRPWTAPAGYDPGDYELLRRHIQANGITSVRGTLLKIDAIEGGKYDVNNQGPFSTDFIGMNYAYPEADYATREQIIAAHEDYQKGLLYFLATDSSLPASIRDEMNSYGLTADEFADNDGWSTQIYVREARRMVGEYVMTDRDVRGLTTVTDPICLGSYTMDSHNTQRYVDAEGHVRNEGDVQIGVSTPYRISYGAITPDEAEAENLLVSSAVSASHIAYGSIRMEPVFMEMGQAAGVAAAMALDGATSVQGIDYLALQEQLIADGALLGWPYNPGPPWVGTVTEDFNHLSGLPANLRDTGGGEGWSTDWTDTGTENVLAGDLATSAGGYLVPQAGPGQPGRVQGVYDQRRQNVRDLAGQMAGEIWLSVLLESPDATARSGLSLNPENNGDPAKAPLTNFFEMVGTDLQVTLGGAQLADAIPALALDQAHLVLARIVLDADEDVFELWVDPADLDSLGPADLAVTDRDVLDALHGMGVLSWNPAGPAWSANGGYVDALRLSNDAGAYQAVTGVPEPASLVLLAVGGLGLLRRRRGRIG